MWYFHDMEFFIIIPSTNKNSMFSTLGLIAKSKAFFKFVLFKHTLHGILTSLMDK